MAGIPPGVSRTREPHQDFHQPSDPVAGSRAAAAAPAGDWQYPLRGRSRLMSRKLLAECLGALLLSACVIGSGIMAERLSAGNAAVALLANTLATVAVLAALIAQFGPISGAHFNPVVTAAALHLRQLNLRLAMLYVM